MSTRDLDSLIAGPLPGPERDRLARVHEVLLRSGAPPELPQALLRPPAVDVPRLRAARSVPSRRSARWAAVAAALAVAVAGVAYALAPRSGGPWRGVAMHSTAAAPAARASLRVGVHDAAGNWQLTLRVRGLPALPAGGYYAMYLTQNGHIVAGCGTFKVDPGTTVVRFNVPFRLDTKSGWIIRREGFGARPGPTLLTT